MALPESCGVIRVRQEDNNKNVPSFQKSADPALGQLHGQDDILRASSDVFSNICRQFGVCSCDLV